MQTLFSSEGVVFTVPANLIFHALEMPRAAMIESLVFRGLTQSGLSLAPVQRLAQKFCGFLSFKDGSC